MRWLRGGLTALTLLAVLAAAHEARAQCSWEEQFWDGVQWVCWTHPLFPEVTLVPGANPFKSWALNWGGTNWRYYGWEPQ